jgi:mono/diheme cytochrome c family protein
VARRGAIVAIVVVVALAAAAAVAWYRARAGEVRERAITTYWQADGPSVRPRRESCTTCHVEHPKAAALVAQHPAATFGCTSCHGGEGTLAAPHPRVVLRDAAGGKGKEWAFDGLERAERREALSRLGGPMPDLPAAAPPLAIAEASRDAFLLALPEIQGGCFKCHAADAELAGAPELTRGRALFRDLGCQSCHAVARLPPVAKPGLPLSDVSVRLTPERLLAYLRDPLAVDPGARMPRAWPAGTDDAARRDETLAVAAYLFERSERRARDGKGANVARASVVAGASADDGKLFYEAYGCKGCHDDAPAARALAPSLAAAGDGWTLDWLAAWSRDPKALASYERARMPSLRLSAREAASVAAYLASRRGGPGVPAEDVAIVREPARRAERAKCSAGGGEMPRTQCGELLVIRHACVACHDLDGAETPRAPGPSLDGFAARARLGGRRTLAVLDAPRAADPNARMPDYDLSAAELRALMVFLAGLGDAVPVAGADADERPEHRARAAGRALMGALQCAECHDAGKLRGVPPLAEEGARVRPEWLVALLDRPERHGVRPALHPEWIYGDLVPPSKLAARMPSYALPTADATAIVRTLAAEGGAEFPFSPQHPAELAPDDRIAAAAALKARCTQCHFVGELPRERAKADAPLAPSLSIVHERLREDWVRDFLRRHVDGALPPKLPDFLFRLREGTVLPRPGAEATSPVLGLGD